MSPPLDPCRRCSCGNAVTALTISTLEHWRRRKQGLDEEQHGEGVWYEQATAVRWSLRGEWTMDNTSKPRVFEDQFTELSVGGGTGRISEVASMSMVVVDGQLEGAHLGSTCDRNRAIWINSRSVLCDDHLHNIGPLNKYHPHTAGAAVRIQDI